MLLAKSVRSIQSSSFRTEITFSLRLASLRCSAKPRLTGSPNSSRSSVLSATNGSPSPNGLRNSNIRPFTRSSVNRNASFVNG